MRTYLSCTLSAVLLLCVLLAGCGGGSIRTGGTTVSLKPTLASVSPSTVQAGSGPVSLTVTGTGFDSTTTLQVNGNQVLVTILSSTELTATLPASLLSTGGALALMVSNSVGSSSAGGSGAVSLEVDNPSPVLGPASPAAVSLASGAQVLSFAGSGFVPSTVVQVNGSPRATTFVSGTQITATLAIADSTTAAPLAITAVNPSPGGGTSAPLTLPVLNPAPTATALSPSSLVAGAASGEMVTITGTNFVPGATAVVNGSTRATTVLSGTQMTVGLVAADAATAGTLAITAVNPAPGGGASSPLSLVVNDPVPAISSLSPSSLAVGANTVGAVTIIGTNFVSGSMVQVNGSARPTTVVSATQLNVQLSVADQATAGTLAITVANPSPGGGTSVPASLQVSNPIPTVTSLSPSSLTAGATTVSTVTIMGTNFVAGSMVQINGSARSTTVASATQLSLQLSVADQATAGTLAITVANPAPGGGTSAPASLQVSNPVPGPLSLSPGSVPAGGTSAISVTVIGTNFVSSSVVHVNGNARTTTFLNAGQLSFQLTPADEASGGTLTVSVVTPAPGGGTSPASSLVILPSPPVLTSLVPATVNLGSASLQITASGNQFTSTTVAVLNGQQLPTTVVSAQTLQFTVPAAALTSVGTLTVLVRDAAVPTAVSSSLTLAVVNPVPVLTSVNPYVVAINSPNTTVTLTGSNFNQGSVVLLGGSPLPTTYLSMLQLSALIPAASLASLGQLSLAVSNPAPQGGLSATLDLPVTPAPPVLTSLTPSSVLVGSPGTVVTVTGQNFTQNTRLSFPGFYGYTTYLSPTSLSFTLSGNLLGSAGSYSITAQDPLSYSQPSNALTLQVLNPVPVLSAITPAAVTAGAPNFLLTLTGTGFLQSSQVTVNGVASPSTTVTATSTSVVLNSSQVAAVGELQIAVVNAGPGGGTSNTETLKVVSADNRVRTVGASAASLGWDAAHGLLLATTTSSSTVSPNSLLAIDPLQGTVVGAQPLPVQPDILAVSDDNSYVYVSLPSTGQVERLLLPSLQPDITFSIGSDSAGFPYRAESLLAAPGHPHTVAVSRHDQGTVLGAKGGVAIYDDGVARPTIAYPNSSYYDNYDALTWGSDSSTLYATDDLISTAEEYVFAVNAQGVTLVSANAGVLNTFVEGMVFDPSTNRLIDDLGGTVNAVTEVSTGSLTLRGVLGSGFEPFTVDTVNRRAYYVGSQFSGVYGADLFLGAYDIDHYTYLNSLLVPGMSSVNALVRWGTSGLASASSTQIFLIDGSFVSSNGVSSATGAYASPSPTFTGVSPAAVPAGSPDVQLTLTGKDFSLASSVSWNNQSLPVDAVTATQLTVTIPAAMLAQPAASLITISNGPGTLPTSSLGFSVLPDLGPTAQIRMLALSGADAAWDATRGVLYVAVPATDPSLANSIAVVDPVAGTVNKIVPVPNQPSTLSLTDDGSYLYAGFLGSPVVQRLALPDLSLDLAIQLGSPAIVGGTPVGGRQTCTFAVDVKAAPGHPHTVAIDQGNGNAEPRGCGALTIYDDGVQRPNAIPYSTRGDFSSLAWGPDATTLFGESDPVLQSQSLSQLAVSAGGVSNREPLASGYLGSRVHFDSGTGYLFSDSGVITNPADASRVGNLFTSSNNGTPLLALTDSVNNRAYLLVTTPGTGTSSNANVASYALQIFNLSQRSLLSSLSLPDVIGNPTQLLRWGSNGLALTTSSRDGSGGVYLLQGSAFVGP